MQSSLNDINKLTKILQDKDDDYSDASDDSNELVNYEHFNIDNTSYDIINCCTNSSLKNALICNIEKRQVLNNIVNKLEDHLVKLKHAYKECRTKIINETKSTRRHTSLLKKRLGTPYFKDNNAFPSPVNADWLKMKENNQLLQSNYLLRNMWSQEDKYNLTKGVYNEICSKRIKEITEEIVSTRDENKVDAELLNKIKLLEYDKKIFSNVDLINSLVVKWQLLHWKPKDEYSGIDQNLKDEQLIVKTVCEWKKTIDWLQISAQILDGRHTDTECQAMWNCYLSPKYSKESWKLNENKLLTELCEKYNYQNWDVIALELNNRRSAYQCCVHFHAKLCEKFNRDKWTPEEDNYLQSVVESCSVGNYISWGRVAYFFKQRTKLQIYRHYKNCTTEKVKKGFFSIEEDILLLTLMKTCDSNIKIIKTYFPNRIVDQLRDRIRTLHTDTSRSWSIQEDSKIIAFVAKHGEKDWIKLTKEINRSSGCIRHRYRKIQKWIELHPGSSVLDLPRRGEGTFRANIRKRQRLVRKVVNFLLEKLEATSNKCKILNIKYIQEIMQPFLKIPEKDSTKSEKATTPININSVISDYFKSSYKCVVRGAIKITNNFIHDSADRIDILLHMLGANLVFPSLDKINNHPMLDDVDKLIISRLISKRQEASQSTSEETIISSPVLKCIVPNIETLIGFRGILLHIHILKNHSRGKYTGYNLYVKHGPNGNYIENGFTYHKAILENMLSKYDDETREVVIYKQQLFLKRLKLIFQWPFVIADTKAEPMYEIPEPPESPRKKLKPGRKKREVKNYKIALMNAARRTQAQQNAEKRSNMHINEVTNENPAKKKKIER